MHGRKKECTEPNAVIQNEIRARIEVQAAYCGCTEKGTINFDWVAVGGDGILKEIVFEWGLEEWITHP